MTYIGRTNLGFKAQQSADGRLRTSSQLSQGDYKQIADMGPNFWDSEVIAGGTYDYEVSGTGATEMAVLTNGDAVVRQSKQWHNYFAGKPTKIELTASKFQLETGVTKVMGYFSSSTTSPYNTDYDGLMFYNDGSSISCRIYREGTLIFEERDDAFLNQNELVNWDPENFNFYYIDFLYLGGAIARFWILTDFGYTLVATYQHINVDFGTFIKSPHQPVRYQIHSTATSASGEFNHICSDVAIEGIEADIGFSFAYNTGTAFLSSMSAGTRYALVGVRHGATFREFTQLINSISVISDSNDNLLVEIYIGGTTVGTPTWSAIPGSHMEGFLGTGLIGGIASAVHSGGTLIKHAYVYQNSAVSDVKISNARRLGSLIDGTSEIYYLTVTGISANSSAAGGLNLRELP